MVIVKYGDCWSACWHNKRIQGQKYKYILYNTNGTCEISIILPLGNLIMHYYIYALEECGMLHPDIFLDLSDGHHLNPLLFRTTHHALPVTLVCGESLCRVIDSLCTATLQDRALQILLISETNNWTRAFGTSTAGSTVFELNIVVA